MAASSRSAASFRRARNLLPSLRRLGILRPIDSNADYCALIQAPKGVISEQLVRENTENLSYQLFDARSLSRCTPLTKFPNHGLATVSGASFSCRSFCSHPSNVINESQGPAAIDYRSVLQEDEFHKLADSTIHDLLEKLEEYGDSIDLDGFDIDYGNEVLTLKLGDLGTYVVNKQTPNRQIWLSSPVSGPSRYDWDRNIQAWIYRALKLVCSKFWRAKLRSFVANLSTFPNQPQSG